MSSQLKADPVLPWPSAIELQKMLTIEQVAQLTTLSPDSINRHHADTIVPKPIDQTKKDGLRNSRRLSETNFIISANSANSPIPERTTLMRMNTLLSIQRLEDHHNEVYQIDRRTNKLSQRAVLTTCHINT